MTKSCDGRRSRSAGLCTLAVLLPFVAVIQPGWGRAQPLGLPAFKVLAQSCGDGVASLTLAAVARTESRFEPLIVGDNSSHRAYASGSLDQAAATAERLMAAGDNIDIGLMQINARNLKRLNLTVRDALDPCSSIAAGAFILTHNYRASHGAADAQTALRDALSMYNTGSAQRGYRNGYVSRVETAASLLAPLMAEGGGASLAAPTPIRSALAAWDVWAATPGAPAGPSDPVQIFVN